jgi:LemA protein
VRESWSSVDVELQRRHDLIPNLVATVKGVMAHERELLEEVTRLRSEAEERRPGPADAAQVAVERRLESALQRLVVRIEAYPELTAQRSVGDLMGELAHTEDRVAAALRYYNGNVRELNTKVETFPTLLFAQAFGVERAEYFQVESDDVRRAPRAELGRGGPA